MRIQGAVDTLAREINLLQEYRTRLVADVVTGKLDVREAAARLPDDIPPDTTSDIDLGDDIDNLDQEADE
jgi:type I restriction enzyme S subunit